VRISLALLFLVILALTLVVAQRWAGRAGDAPRGQPEAGATVGEWTGSAVCAACHPDLYRRWEKTGHALGVRPFAPDVVARPFDGEVFVARDKDHRLGPGPSMACEGPGGDPRTFPVETVVGVRRVQMFLTTLPGGRIQVLPVFLEVPPRRWFDYTDFIFGGPNDFEVPADSAYSWYGPHRNWSSRCGRCHMTNFEIGYDADTGSYRSTWSENATGCETCHGAGGAHVRKWRRLEDGPDPIVNPDRLPIARANEICGYCHSESYMVAPGYEPGDDLFAFVDVTGLEDEKHAFPDGRARELFHNFVTLLESRCGPLACTHCHDAHGHGIPGDLYRPLSDDWFCLQCHGEIAVRLTEHTHHPADNEGSRCVGCHMPRLVIEGGHGRVFDHTISTPSMRNTRELGLPNACRSCHDDQFPGWEYESFARWYPEADERNHRVPLAAAIAAGRARRPEAQALLVELLGNGNPVYRAVAAWLLASYPVDLRPILADPHPLVRRAAVEGVAARHPEALEPLLDDASPVLRRAAALALASRRVAQAFDYIAARPDLRARARVVLEACARMRPDDADLHFTLARIHELDDRPDAARAARARYRRLRPWMK
jgi:hypothetical protein